MELSGTWRALIITRVTICFAKQLPVQCWALDPVSSDPIGKVADQGVGNHAIIAMWDW
jgi:hypothetical protein